MMEKYVIYTIGDSGYTDLWIFSRLQSVFGTKLDVELILIGTEETNEPFRAWAKANGVRSRTHVTLSDKYGYSALVKSIKRLFHEETITGLLVLKIDAQSMDISHIARDKQVRVITL
jgi:hypothetical protein|tara:strand:+ start:1864 stop:2214 length:351 start_codon:yes stop_codon:yes gene_type:complete